MNAALNDPTFKLQIETLQANQNAQMMNQRLAAAQATET